MVIFVAQENPRHHYTKNYEKTLKFKAKTKTLWFKTMTITITVANNKMSHEINVSRPTSFYLNNVITSANLTKRTVLK